MSSDAGNSDLPKSSLKQGASFKWKGESFQLVNERKKWFVEVAKIYRKNNSSIHETVKKEK